MTYDEVLKYLMTIGGVPINQEDENFKRLVPLMFTYADNRIYRELDFLASTTVTTGFLVANNREVALPPQVLVLRQMNVLTQPTPVVPLLRRALVRVSPEALDMFSEPWYIPGVLPVTPAPGLPEKFAIIGHEQRVGLAQIMSHVIRLMPVPDQNYATEYLGVIRPDVLSPTNPRTYISDTYPELLCAACMVFISGYQRDFGAQADDPAKAMSWEGQYTSLRASAQVEAARLKGVA
jgi:hypothetical protein